jgi:rare lipoprotein A
MTKLIQMTYIQRIQRLSVLLVPLLLTACATVSLDTPSSTSTKPAATTAQSSTSAGRPSAMPSAGSGRGGYYKDDGPQDSDPPGLENTPDAIPKIEPYRPANSRPYVVFGKTYTPITDERPFKQRGIGSWYGKKFHGQKTSSGEPYDMYQMTAAHPTLPIPSYARVTNIRNGKTVIVRVNDRGPFHSSRIIDLSYTAALRLDYLSGGSSELLVERLLPEDIRQIQAGAQKANPGVEMGEVTSANVAVSALDSPVVVASPAASAQTQTAVPTGAGFYLQFGAYSKEENAVAAKNRLLQSLTGVVTHLDVVPSNGLYRLISSAYGSRALAQNAAQQVQQRGVTPLVVER